MLSRGKTARYINTLMLACFIFTNSYGICDIRLSQVHVDEEFLLYETEEEIELEELGEFIPMYLDMERELDLAECEDDEFVKAEFFLKKWTRKLKRWFKKKLMSLLKHFLNIKNEGGSMDYCAYTVAKHKRLFDKLYNTGKIDRTLAMFDRHCPKNVPPGFKEEFKERVRYYVENPKKRVSDGLEYDFLAAKEKEKQKYPPRAIFGGLEIFTGALICALPFPGTEYIGKLLIGTGFALVCESCCTEYEKNHYQEEL